MSEVDAPYRTTAKPKRTRIHHLREMKERGERWPMLTAYDHYSAQIFDEAGIPVLLVGDSAGNNVYGYDNTIPVTVDELMPLVRAVVRGAASALVVADLPFGSYQVNPEQALTTAIRFMKEAGAHAVKLEGGARFAPHVEAMVAAGIPVMAHLGFTPQSEHALGGFRIQGRGDAGERLIEDALAMQAAGAFAVVLEMVPADVAKRVTGELVIPTIGIGAGPDTDAQVLVWSDMAGMNRGRKPKFVKQYADVGEILLGAARAYADEVRGGQLPGRGALLHLGRIAAGATRRPSAGRRRQRSRRPPRPPRRPPRGRASIAVAAHSRRAQRARRPASRARSASRLGQRALGGGEQRAGLAVHRVVGEAHRRDVPVRRRVRGGAPGRAGCRRGPAR